MADLNKVFLMGRLTFDPELRRTPSGTAVTELRLATTRIWSGRDGERREETLFIDVTVWDRQAENCCQFLRKGSADPRRRLAEDGHLGRQEHGREAVEDPRARRSRAVPRQPSRRFGRRDRRWSDDDLAAAHSRLASRPRGAAASTVEPGERTTGPSRAGRPMARAAGSHRPTSSDRRPDDPSRMTISRSEVR